MWSRVFPKGELKNKLDALDREHRADSPLDGISDRIATANAVAPADHFAPCFRVR